jgi:SAM-dependent methyltransferase
MTLKYVKTNEGEREKSKLLPQVWGGLAAVHGLREGPSGDMVDSVSTLKEHGARKVIDIGCGNGRNSVFLAKQGFDVTALDFSQEALKILKGRTKDEKLENVNSLLGSATRIPVQDATFDAALTHFVFKHLSNEERKEAVKEMHRVLKPGGIALVTEPLPEKGIRELFKDFRLVSLKEKHLIADKHLPYWVLVAEKKKEQPAKELETVAGVVKLREEPGFGEGKSYGVILKPSDSSEERKIGTVYVILRKVEELSLQPRSILMKEGLRGDDSIAEIFGFTPFWELTKNLAPDVEEHIKEKFMRKKIGTATMKLLLNELKSGEVIGAYCRTNLEEMRGLLKKFEFQEICETAYFKRF